MRKTNSSTKRLLVVLAILAIVALALGVWQSSGGIKFIPVTVKNENPVKVGELKNDKEKAIGTIIYPGLDAEKIELLKNDLAQKVSFNVKDSPEGVINIYSQDLLNRYSDATVTRKEIQKSDALDQKATVLTASRQSGKITVTVWANPNGLTSVTVEKENSF